MITIHTISPTSFNLCLPSNWGHPGKSEPALRPLRTLRPLPYPSRVQPISPMVLGGLHKSPLITTLTLDSSSQVSSHPVRTQQ